MKERIVIFSDIIGYIFLCLLVFFMGFSSAGIEICVSSALLVYAIRAVAKGDLKEMFTSSKLDLPILCFVLANIISYIINSLYFNGPIRYLFSRVGEYIMLYFLVIKAVNRGKRFNTILGILLFSSCLVGISGVYQQFTGLDLLRQRPLVNSHITSSFKHYNCFGGYLTLILPLSISITLSDRLRRICRIGGGILSALLTYCLVLTYSRGAWIGVIFGLIFIFGYYYRNASGVSFTKKLLIMFLVIAFFIGISFILPRSIKQRAVSIVRLESSGRLGIDGLYMRAIRLINQRPFFGNGVASYIYKSRSVWPHNSYLQMAGEIGLIGLFSFFWILIDLFIVGGRYLRKDKNPFLLGILAGILSFCIHCFFDSNLYWTQLAISFWFMVGLAISLYKINYQQNRLEYGIE
ncbi:MAG: O-antigen ligase family protein [Candidatus Omnitrophica bacterium]|nr:O-antigen ligase family protein [Candidatus Omnitrophota bacterium]